MIIANLTLPWPPIATSPNGSQGKFRAKASAAAAYKRTCWAICLERKIRKIDALAVEATIIFCPPSNVNRYDLDNTLIRAKQGLDAIAEAIGVDDSQWRSITLERGEKCKDGGVIVHIHEVMP